MYGEVAFYIEKIQIKDRLMLKFLNTLTALAAIGASSTVNANGNLDIFLNPESPVSEFSCNIGGTFFAHSPSSEQTFTYSARRYDGRTISLKTTSHSENKVEINCPTSSLYSNIVATSSDGLEYTASVTIYDSYHPNIKEVQVRGNELSVYHNDKNESYFIQDPVTLESIMIPAGDYTSTPYVLNTGDANPMGFLLIGKNFAEKLPVRELRKSKLQLSSDYDSFGDLYLNGDLIKSGDLIDVSDKSLLVLTNSNDSPVAFHYVDFSKEQVQVSARTALYQSEQSSESNLQQDYTFEPLSFNDIIGELCSAYCSDSMLEIKDQVVSLAEEASKFEKSTIQKAIDDSMTSFDVLDHTYNSLAMIHKGITENSFDFSAMQAYVGMNFAKNLQKAHKLKPKYPELETPNQYFPNYVKIHGKTEINGLRVTPTDGGAYVQNLSMNPINIGVISDYNDPCSAIVQEHQIVSDNNNAYSYLENGYLDRKGSFYKLTGTEGIQVLASGKRDDYGPNNEQLCIIDLIQEVESKEAYENGFTQTVQRVVSAGLSVANMNDAFKNDTRVPIEKFNEHLLNETKAHIKKISEQTFEEFYNNGGSLEGTKAIEKAAKDSMKFIAERSLEYCASYYSGYRKGNICQNLINRAYTAIAAGGMVGGLILEDVLMIPEQMKEKTDSIITISVETPKTIVKSVTGEEFTPDEIHLSIQGENIHLINRADFIDPLTGESKSLSLNLSSSKTSLAAIYKFSEDLSWDVTNYTLYSNDTPVYTGELRKVYVSFTGRASVNYFFYKYGKHHAKAHGFNVIFNYTEPHSEYEIKVLNEGNEVFDRKFLSSVNGGTVDVGFNAKYAYEDYRINHKAMEETAPFSWWWSGSTPTLPLYVFKPGTYKVYYRKVGTDDDWLQAKYATLVTGGHYIAQICNLSNEDLDIDNNSASYFFNEGILRSGKCQTNKSFVVSGYHGITEFEGNSLIRLGRVTEKNEKIRVSFQLFDPSKKHSDQRPRMYFSIPEGKDYVAVKYSFKP